MFTNIEILLTDRITAKHQTLVNRSDLQIDTKELTEKGANCLI